LRGCSCGNPAALRISLDTGTQLCILLQAEEPRLSAWRPFFMILLKLRNPIIAGFFGAMVALGIFVNVLLLVVAVASLCGVAHLFAGHYSGTKHTHDTAHGEKDVEPSASGSWALGALQAHQPLSSVRTPHKRIDTFRSRSNTRCLPAPV